MLETLKDVGAISLQGDRRREIQLLLNADRLNAYGLTVEQVRTAIERQNVEVPGGNFVSGPSEVALRTLGRIKNVEDFNRIVLAYREGSVITFGDIGRVVDGIQEVRGANKLNGVAVGRSPGSQAVGDQYRRGGRPRRGQAAADSGLRCRRIFRSASATTSPASSADRSRRSGST